MRSARTASSVPSPGPSRSGPVVDWTEITVTSRCNQRCFFCYEASRKGDPDPPLEHVKKLIRETRRHSEQLVFCGREALLRSDIFEMVAYAKALGLRPVVFTNGQALHRAERVARLAEAGCSAVAVSFHFPDAATFAVGARVSPRCFERVLEGLRNVRDYNRAHPDRRLGVSTETDMFSLNVGRLQEMRATLLEALGDTGWSMRLAGLLPVQVHDIGLPTIVDGLATRREEVAAFVRTHPRGVALGFVKVPLCLLPEGEEHRCLDVQYVHEGTRMSFNHLALDRIDVDRASVTSERSLESPLQGHPYRWVCRTCAVMPMCRFQRVSWTEPGFHPCRADRPLPYRPSPPAAGGADDLGLPCRTRSAVDVLAPLGGNPDAVARVAAACRAAAAQPFPEEELLAALHRAPAEGPALADAWVQETPVVEVELQDGNRKLRLGLVAPGVRAGESCAIVDYLAVRPLEETAPPTARLRRALRRLANVPLPDVGRWSADPWFDMPTALRRRAAWRRLGEVLWPGIGRIGPWRTTVVRSEPSADVEVRLDHACGTRAELAWRAEEGSPEAPLGLTFRRIGSRTPRSDVAGLLAALQERVTGRVGPAPRLPAAGGALRLHLRHDRWVRGALPVAPRAGTTPRAEDELVLRVNRGDDWVVEFHVARTRGSRPAFRTIGGLSLWYGQAVMDRPALAWAQIVVSVMRHLRARPFRAAAVPRWRAAFSELARHNPWTCGFRWELEWRTAARDRARAAAHA